MSGDVLRRTATRPLADDFIVARLLVFIEFALRMSIKISAFAVEDEQEQQFGVQARRRHVILNEQMVCGINGLLELHAGELYRKGRQGRKGAKVGSWGFYSVSPSQCVLGL